MFTISSRTPVGPTLVTLAEISGLGIILITPQDTDARGALVCSFPREQHQDLLHALEALHDCPDPVSLGDDGRTLTLTFPSGQVTNHSDGWWHTGEATFPVLEDACDHLGVLEDTFLAVAGLIGLIRLAY